MLFSKKIIKLKTESWPDERLQRGNLDSNEFILHLLRMHLFKNKSIISTLDIK